MKKTVTFEEEIRVCDFCGTQENFVERFYIKACGACGKDVCERCGLVVARTDSTYVCPDHFEKGLKSKIYAEPLRNLV